MKKKLTIKQHFEIASKLAHKEMERLATEILKRHKNLKSFEIEMGIAMFIDIDNKSIYTEEYKYMSKLDKLLRDWNKYFYLTQGRMSITTKGKQTYFE